MPGYTVKPGVTLKPDAQAFVAAVATEVDKALVVTSGYRDPDKQAAAMYTKFKVGGSYHIYRQTLPAKAVYDAYVSGMSSGSSKAQVVEDMAAILRKQVSNHIYLSRHMRATAVDFRTFNLTRLEKQQLEKACKKHGASVVIDEGHPPHLHVQF